MTPPRKMSLAGVRYAHASSHTSKGKQTTSLNLRTRINAIDHLSGELFLAWQLTGVGPPAARGNRKVGDCQPSTSKLSAVNVNFTAAKKRNVLAHSGRLAPPKSIAPFPISSAFPESAASSQGRHADVDTQLPNTVLDLAGRGT